MLPAAVPPTLLGTGAMSEDEIIYYYRISAATDTYYKAMSATSPTGLSPYFQRFKMDRHALRVTALISGKIGYFAVASLLVTLTVSLGLMSVAVLVTDMCMTQCCRLRHIYRQYQERWTPDFSDLREALDDSILTKFRSDQFLVDPVPPVLSNAMVQHQSRVYQRGTRAGGAYDVEGALKGGPGSAPLLAGLDEEGGDDSASAMDGRSAVGGGGVSVTGGSGRLITVAITGRHRACRPWGQPPPPSSRALAPAASACGPCECQRWPTAASSQPPPLASLRQAAPCRQPALRRRLATASRPEEAFPPPAFRPKLATMQRTPPSSLSISLPLFTATCPFRRWLRMAPPTQRLHIRHSRISAGHPPRRSSHSWAATSISRALPPAARLHAPARACERLRCIPTPVTSAAGQ